MRERVPHEIRTDTARMTKGDMRDHRMGRPFGGIHPIPEDGVLYYKTIDEEAPTSEQPPHQYLPT